MFDKSICIITSINSLISLLSFYLTDFSSGESRVLKSPAVSVWGLMCDLSFRSASFTYEDALVFGGYVFSVDISS